MAWSKVHKPLNKPIGWWYHKLLCEFAYSIQYRPYGLRMYYHHLTELCKYGYNLYGNKI